MVLELTTTGMGIISMKVIGRMAKNAVSSVDLPKILGNGKFSMKDGSFYEGNFIDGEISGRGRRYYALSKNEYIGQFMLGERHGYGRMNYADGSIYEGDWSHNLQQGQGKYIGADGSKYTGGFIANKRNGAGCLWSHAFAYWGYWRDNLYDGMGVLKIIDGTTYEGEFSSGKPNGQGKLTHKTNLLPSYEGSWKNGLPCREANYLRLSVEAERDRLQYTPSYLVEYRNSPIKEETYKFATFSKMEISSDELKSKISVDICVYTESRQILIEESNRQLAVWVGKICKENLQSRIPVELQVQVETPLLSSMKEKGIYVMETPFGFSLYPVGSVTLNSSKNEEVIESSPIHLENADSSANDISLNLAAKLKVKNKNNNDNVDNESRRLVNEVFVHTKLTSRGFISCSIAKSLTSDGNLSDLSQPCLSKSTHELSAMEDFIDLSFLEKSILLFEEFINSPRSNRGQLGDQLILVVEDITLQNSEDESIYELDAIPNYVFKAPRHLPPLFIKLCYNALE
ncbi:unnamed protein product [Heterobilharzia americana]|nr:unnamed protein product [Heterobilharzia americana]